MDNRKIIVAFYLTSSMVLWFLSRSSVQYLYLTFYQVRRMPGVGILREILPVGLGAVLFLLLLGHARVNVVLDEVVSELRKVTWPSKEEVIRSTIVVIICIVLCSLILGVFDLMWGKVITFLLNG